MDAECEKPSELPSGSEEVEVEGEATPTNTKSMTESKYMINVSGVNTVIIGDHITNSGEKGGPFNVSNCYKPQAVHRYWPRTRLDNEIKTIEKGKVKILRGTIGTGKTSAALNYIAVNKEKFAISWVIDASSEDRIKDSLKKLAEELKLDEKFDASYPDLFKTIERIAEEKNVIFLLDDVEKRPNSSEWFKLLWGIRSSVYVIITTNNPSLILDLTDAGTPELHVDTFDEALDFLKDIHSENGEEDLKELCRFFGWNILGLTAAKDYMSVRKVSVQWYLRMLRDNMQANKVRQLESSEHDRILYESVHACLKEVESDKFDAIAATSLLSNDMIPDFLLSNLLPAPSNLANLEDLNVLHDQLKSLVRITEENGIRFFSFHSFTQCVIRDMVRERNPDLIPDLLNKLAGIFVRHISKDNRFSKGDFLQRTAREHAEKFLREWEGEEKDARTTIALARLSELVGFTYTQQRPILEHELDKHFERARKLLHELCGITQEDLKPAEHGLVNEMLKKCNVLWESFFLAEVSSEDRYREIYGITDNHLVVAHQLFEKLSRKSSELSSDVIKELVFSRTVSKQDLLLFPEAVKANQMVKEKIDFAEPLTPEDVRVLVQYDVAYDVDQYSKLFLPELYLSLIYSFGRNYFYMNRATMKKPHFYIDLLKIAYCLSRMISEQMNNSDAVFHEYLVETNGLLYLLVNEDYFNEDDAHMTKEAQVHASDLENAIDRYHQLICDERRFFEMGILKRTKDDAYSQLVCYQQILRCYKHLLSLEDIGRHEEYIRNAVQRCRDVSKLLETYAAKDTTRTGEDLVQYSRHMNAIAEFYLSINREEYYSEVRKIFILSAEHAENHDLAFYHLEALVGLADVLSRMGKYRFLATRISFRHLKRCNSNESLLKMQRQKPHIQERIRKIQKQNVVLVLRYWVRLRLRHEEGTGRLDGTIDPTSYIDETDDVESVSSNSNNSNEDEELTGADVGGVTSAETYQHPTSNALPDTLPEHGGDEQPQDIAMNKHLMKLAHEVAGDWEILATFLGVSDAKKQQISRDNNQKVVLQAYEMLKHWWLSNGKDANSGWRDQLAQALREFGRVDLAEDFTGDVLQTNT